jgi:multiple antibiotic resistance protein
LKILETIAQKLLHDYLLLFAMVNAIGNLPVFADFTISKTRKERNEIFTIAVLTAAGVVIGLALIGDLMLRYYFLVSTSAFKIAAGILVFIVAAKGVTKGSSSMINPNEAGNTIAIFPLGFPYLAGPGTILTTIILIQSDGRLLTVITGILVYATILPILRLSSYVQRIVGKLGVMVIARILYIFLAAKSISFIFDGLSIPI